MGYIEDLRSKPQGQGRLRWRVRYRDPAGRERAKSFARKVDAERFLQHAEADKLRGLWVDPQQGRRTVGELAERWYATTVTLKPKTREDYRSLLNNHVLPAFGDRAVASLDTLAVRGWLAGLVSKGLSPSRAKHAYYILFAVLEAAIQVGALVRNPAARVRVPHTHSREMHFLSAAEVERLAEAIVPPYGVLVRFAAYTGLRAGEIAALRVKRLDLLRGSVRVVESATEVGGRLMLGPTKTHADRTVRLPRFLREELAAYLADRPRDPDAFLFTAPRGGPLRHHNFYQRLFCPALPRAGLPGQIRFHDLRHTCAALLIAQGAHPKAIQAHLGHSSIQVTMDRYGHLFPDALEHLADRLDAVRTQARTDPERIKRRDGLMELSTRPVQTGRRGDFMGDPGTGPTQRRA
jgi:integrase